MTILVEGTTGLLILLSLLVFVVFFAGNLLGLAVDSTFIHWKLTRRAITAGTRAEARSFIYTVVAVVIASPWIALTTNWATVLIQGGEMSSGITVMVTQTAVIAILGLLALRILVRASDAGPLQYASLLRDLEESVLSGRMDLPLLRSHLQRRAEIARTDARTRGWDPLLLAYLSPNMQLAAHQIQLDATNAAVAKNLITFPLAHHMLGSSWRGWLRVLPNALLLVALLLIGIEETGPPTAEGTWSPAAAALFGLCSGAISAATYVVTLTAFRWKLVHVCLTRLETIAEKRWCDVALLLEAGKLLTPLRLPWLRHDPAGTAPGVGLRRLLAFGSGANTDLVGDPQMRLHSTATTASSTPPGSTTVPPQRTLPQRLADAIHAFRS